MDKKKVDKTKEIKQERSSLTAIMDQAITLMPIEYENYNDLEKKYPGNLHVFFDTLNKEGYKEKNKTYIDRINNIRKDLKGKKKKYYYYIDYTSEKGNTFFYFGIYYHEKNDFDNYYKYKEDIIESLVNKLNSDDVNRVVKYVKRDGEDSTFARPNYGRGRMILCFKLCGNSLFLRYREAIDVENNQASFLQSLPKVPSALVFPDLDDCDIPQNPIYVDEGESGIVENVSQPTAKPYYTMGNAAENTEYAESVEVVHKKPEYAESFREEKEVFDIPPEVEDPIGEEDHGGGRKHFRRGTSSKGGKTALFKKGKKTLKRKGDKTTKRKSKKTMKRKGKKTLKRKHVRRGTSSSV